MEHLPAFSSFSVLVVDDDKFMRSRAIEALQKLFKKVDSCESGEEAINKCKQNDYRIIFMDIEMPKMDGYEATKEIRELEKRKSNDSIITALSGHIVCKDILAKCLNSGMNDCLVKPLDIEVLRRRIQLWQQGKFPSIV